MLPALVGTQVLVTSNSKSFLKMVIHCIAKYSIPPLTPVRKKAEAFFRPELRPITYIGKKRRNAYANSNFGQVITKLIAEKGT